MKHKKISLKLIMCILLVGTTAAYIISAYFSSISFANDKFPSELPEFQMSIGDVEKRLNKLISYSIGNSIEDAPQAQSPVLSASQGSGARLRSAGL